jgi:hypothetical protein
MAVREELKKSGMGHVVVSKMETIKGFHMEPWCGEIAATTPTKKA